MIFLQYIRAEVPNLSGRVGDLVSFSRGAAGDSTPVVMPRCQHQKDFVNFFFGGGGRAVSPLGRIVVTG